MSKILIIGDDKHFLESFIDAIPTDLHRISVVTSDEMAMEELKDGIGFSVIVIDHHMPHVNGNKLIRYLKGDSDYRNIPVICISTSGDYESYSEAIKSGAHAYLIKPINSPLLLTLVNSAIKHHDELVKINRAAQEKGEALHFLQEGRYHCRTIIEAGRLANGLAHLCPDQDWVRLVLHELLINAIEHGNLEIGYSEKSRLIQEDQLNQEAERRLSDPVYCDRRATVEFCRVSDCLTFTIQDEVSGFDWQSYLHVDPDRLMDANGRGIAMSNLSAANAIEYQGNGNTVKVTVPLPSTRA